MESPAAGRPAPRPGADRVQVPSWLRPGDPEDRLPVIAAITVAIALQLSVPSGLSLDPRWLVPALEVALVLLLTTLRLPWTPTWARAERLVGLCLVAAITLDTTWSAALLDRSIVTASAVSNDAGDLLVTGGAVYATNIIAFGVWYWQLDRGGPHARAAGDRDRPDFLFPQMGLDPTLVRPGWRPEFGDYLYLAYTNVVAFSPTDTLPLTRWAKGLMAAQSIVAFTTTALVVARAVNVLR